MHKFERNESRVRVCHKWLEATLESIADAVIATDIVGAVTAMNAAAERLTGWSLAEAHRRSIEETMVIRRRSTGELLECPVRRILRGETVRVEDALPEDAVLIRRDGSTVSIADSVAEIREPSGTLSGAVMVFRDVTGRVRELERLSFLSQASGEMNASLDYEVTLSTVARLAVPTIADGCAVMLARDGDITALATAHADAVKDERLRELLAPPRPCRTIPAIDPGEPTLIGELTDAVAAQLGEQCCTVLRALDVKSYISVPLNRSAKSLGAIILFSSDRRFDKSDLDVVIALAERAAIAVENARLFKELGAARAEADSRRIEAELANRAKDEFLAVLGHELRNPLAPIATALDLMRLRSNGCPALAIVERQVKHMTRLVDDLLDISRITRAKLVLSKERIDLAEVIANGIDLANPLLERNRQRLSVSVAPDMWVDGDAVRLAQVIANLLNNAAKYSDPGSLIAIRVERQDGDVVVSVRDDGVGIDTRALPHIFEPFVQQPQGLDRAEGGLGLGLAIVRGIVQVHDGTVSARSDGPGKGAEIVVRLPAQARPVAEETADATSRWLTTQRRARVLVVDDNLDALMLLVELLGYLGYEVVYADDGESALELACSTRPSVALIDIGLPGMDGYELARRLRQIEELDGLKLVAVTGYGRESDRACSRAAGFDLHLVKPVAMDTLQATLAMFTGSADKVCGLRREPGPRNPYRCKGQ
jgi:PAS domain S-box-containing protein